MADTSLFSRLRRLFSNDVIIRNVGGKQLKIMDSGQIQKYGNLASNSLYDRFTRLHKPVGSSLQYNPTLNYQSMRLQLYSDYEAMDHDPIIAAALDIISDETTIRNQYGDVLNINSSDENVRRVLHNLFYDVLNIEFNLATWVRNMCKYGDFYLKLEVSEKFGVYNVLPLSTYEVVREEGTDPENPAYVQFTLDPNGLASGATNTIRRDQFTLENYEVAHFRLLTDSNYLPYGRSYLEPARKVFKQLMLMEDAMLIHRIMRAPEKRTFFVNVGSIPPAEVDQFMQKTVNGMKKTPYVDPKTGQYNLKFNMQNMMEDFYVPVRGGDASTRIETTKGLDYDGTNDIQYLQAKMFAALKIPKAYFGYEGDLSGKATLAAEDVRFARTIERIQRTVVSELTKIAIVHLYSHGIQDSEMTNFELQLVNPSTIYEQEKVNLWSEKIRLAQDIAGLNMLSKDWVYENIFKLSGGEQDEQRVQMLDDLKDRYRFRSIEDEGNDPAMEDEEPDDIEESLEALKQEIKDKGGRPREGGTYKKDKHPLGRDPLGDKERTKERNRTSEEKAIKMISGIASKRKYLHEMKGMLDETNILDE